MYNNIFTGKYGSYSSEYELSNGYIKPKNYNKVNKHVYLASLLNKINFDFLNNIVGDSIKKLYACIPLFNTAEVVIIEDNKDKVFSL